MPPLSVFGIDNDGVNLVVNLLLLFVVVIWLATIYWTYADARRRMTDPMLIGCATAAAVFPFAGALVYMIVRPPEYLEDVRERELEIQATEARLHELGHHVCPYCHAFVERDFLRCPACTRRLRSPCPSCARPLDPNWQLCPYCEADLSLTAESRPRRRRRTGTTTEQPAVTEAPPTAAT